MSMEQALRSALRFAASRSAITSAEEKEILAAWDVRKSLTCSDDVEIIAKAIVGDGPNWKRWPDVMKEPFRKQARRVIAALTTRKAP